MFPAGMEATRTSANAWLLETAKNPANTCLHALTHTAVGQPDAEVSWTLPARVQGAGLISASHEDGIGVMQYMAEQQHNAELCAPDPGGIGM